MSKHFHSTRYVKVETQQHKQNKLEGLQAETLAVN